jgi:hypothetical protein
MRYAILSVGLLATLPTSLMVGLLTATTSSTVMAQDKSNDTPATAERTSLNNRVKGTLASAKDVNFYSVAVNADKQDIAHDTSGNLTLTFSQKAPPGSNPKSGWRFDLYAESDLANILYTMAWPETTLTTKLEIGLGVGKYYYKVSSLDSEAFPTVEYTIKGTWEESKFYEKSPNNSPDTATPIIPNQEYFGNLSLPEQVDFYRVNLDNPDTVTVTLTQKSPGSDPTTGWAFGLLNQPDQAVNMLSTEQSRSLQVPLQPGVYYIRIEGLSLNQAGKTSDKATGDTATDSTTPAASVEKKAPVGRRYQLLVSAPSAPKPVQDCQTKVTYGQNPMTQRWVSFPTPCDVPTNWVTSETAPTGFKECPVCPACIHASYIFKPSKDGLLNLPQVDLKDEGGQVLGTYSAQLQEVPDQQPSQFKLLNASPVVESATPPATTPATETPTSPPASPSGTP